MVPWLPVTRNSSAGLFTERKDFWDELRYVLVHFTLLRLVVLVFVETRWFSAHCLLMGDTIVNDICAGGLRSAASQRNALLHALVTPMLTTGFQGASAKIMHRALQCMNA